MYLKKFPSSFPCVGEKRQRTVLAASVVVAEIWLQLGIWDNARTGNNEDDEWLWKAATIDIDIKLH